MAERHDLVLRKQRGHGFYLLNPSTNALVFGWGPVGADADLDDVAGFLASFA